MRRWWAALIVLGVAGVALVLVGQWRQYFFPLAARPSVITIHEDRLGWVHRVAWLGSPGALSAAHANLSSQCQACHVPFRRVPDAQCLSCHAKNRELLSRQDTRFHAEATRCIACHTEHLGRAARISRMEHELLRPDVACTACHVDRHQAAFGERCAECHEVLSWKVAGYRHPSPRSQVCAECHVEPPSHRMMHFQMVDRAVTGERDATVEQCWRCHTTDHWNNIKGVGFYVHH